MYRDPIGHRIKTINNLMRKTMDKKTGQRPDRVTLMHCWIIGFVQDREDSGLDTFPKDIEKEFGLRPSTAPEVLKALEKKELICRVSEKQDARLKRIEFTSKAEEIRHLIAAEIGESESILLKGITEEERQIFIAIGERMLKNLDEANQ